MATASSARVGRTPLGFTTISIECDDILLILLILILLLVVVGGVVGAKNDDITVVYLFRSTWLYSI